MEFDTVTRVSLLIRTQLIQPFRGSELWQLRWSNRHWAHFGLNLFGVWISVIVPLFPRKCFGSNEANLAMPA